jgi:hypothetical protein
VAARRRAGGARREEDSDRSIPLAVHSIAFAKGSSAQPLGNCDLRDRARARPLQAAPRSRRSARLLRLRAARLFETHGQTTHLERHAAADLFARERAFDETLDV